MWPGIRFPCTQCHHRGNIQSGARCRSKASMLPQSHFVIITETVETVAEKFQQTITGKSFTFFQKLLYKHFRLNYRHLSNILCSIITTLIEGTYVLCFPQMTQVTTRYHNIVYEAVLHFAIRFLPLSWKLVEILDIFPVCSQPVQSLVEVKQNKCCQVVTFPETKNIYE